MNVTIEQNKIDMSLYDEYFDRLINLPKNLIEYFQKGQNIAVDTNKEEINNIYLKEIKSILNTAENIQEALKKDHMNIIEYYNFAEIKRMLENTLLKSDISEIDEENLTILIELISKLKKINDLKFKLLKKVPNVDRFSEMPDEEKDIFMKEYKKFKKDLFDFRIIYYSKLPESETITKETVHKVFNETIENINGVEKWDYF